MSLPHEVDRNAICRLVREVEHLIGQRDKLREALDFMVAQFGIHDCPAVRQARAALEETNNE